MRSAAPIWPHSLRRPLLAALLGGTLLASLPALAMALPWSVAARTDHAVGGGPEWSTVADLNNDGYYDIATANLYTNNVSVLLNDGTGNYLPKSDYPAGAGPYTVTAFDLNSDYFQDLVVANFAAGTVSVLMGNGTGTFNTKTDHVSGPGTANAAIGWLDEDGNADIATANYYANTVSVFTGDGAGGFTSKTDFAVGNNPNWVAVGDVNSDSYADLVTANDAGNSITVLLGDGTGAFGSRTDIATGNGPLTLTLTDLNNDGILDVTTADYADNTLSVLLGNGGGGFTRTTLGTGSGPVTVVSGDVNLDGNVDLAVCNANSASVSVLFGNGDGTFLPKSDLAVGSAPFAVRIVDVTQDGEPDLVSCNFGDNSISVLKGNVPGGFAVGDTLADLTAFDQNGISRALSDNAGKWLAVDVCSGWCHFCQVMAPEVQPVYDLWAQAGLPFEYITVMVDGPTGITSTQADVQDWADRFGIARPVLHGQGKPSCANRSWYSGIGTNAFPTMMIIGPDRKIRYVAAGALFGQELIDQVAALAGVPAPTLPGHQPPDPPPLGSGPTPPWQALKGGIGFAKYGTNTPWSGYLANHSDPENWSKSVLFEPVDGIPGLTNGVFQVECQTDSVSGEERVQVYLGSVTFIPFPTAEPYDLNLAGMTWQDFGPRVLAPGNDPEVWILYLKDGVQAYMRTGMEAQVLMGPDGYGLDIAPITLANVPNLPASAWGLAVTGIALKHQFAVADVGSRAGGALALAPPGPNPARRSTTMRWAMPKTGRADLEVVDLAGRVVRRLHSGSATLGDHTTTWDLRDGGGSRVAPGLYFVRLDAEGQPVQSTRVVVLE